MRDFQFYEDQNYKLFPFIKISVTNCNGLGMEAADDKPEGYLKLLQFLIKEAVLVVSAWQWVSQWFLSESSSISGTALQLVEWL